MGQPRSSFLSRTVVRWLPVLDWARDYDRIHLTGDLLAAGIVTLMLIPQSLAYAMLAGLPAQAGLYASMLPLVVYAVFGSSRTLSVGPAAVTSLMTAAAVGQLAGVPGADAQTVAVVLALLSGLMLVVMGVLRLGFLANYLSHPVISGFISGSGVLIAFSQFQHILGVPASGSTLPALVESLWQGLEQINGPTVAIGVAMLVFLGWARRGLKPLLLRLGASPFVADVMAKAAPVAGIVTAIVVVGVAGLAEQGVRVVGEVPQGLPALSLPAWNPALWRELVVPALLLGVVGFVESISVGQSLAARRRQRIEPDQELVALGAANVAAACSAGLPVTGGLSRSVVNFDAGARTPAAGAMTAVGIAVATLLFTPWLRYLPQAALAATIIVAVLSLVDLHIYRRTWTYSRFDFAVVAATTTLTLLAGVEAGLVGGVGLALALHLYRSSRPHIAEVGQVPGTEHFRNVLRHRVACSEKVLGLRVDESLYFANARYLEDWINRLVASRSALQHVVLLCSAINDIDASALESLEAIQARLAEAGIALHLSEVKGPLMDRLERTGFRRRLSGKVFLTHYQAISCLAPESLV